MELALSLSNLTNTVSEKISELQEKFWNSTFGNALNNALNVGLRFILPDVMEDEIIEIKDAFLQNGISSGINQIVETVKDYATTVLNNASGIFENISQAKEAIQSMGVVNTISSVLDSAIDKLQDLGIINESFATLIKNGKNVILNTTSEEVSNTLDEQEEYLEQLESYNEAWKEAFEVQDLEKMEEAYSNIEEYLEKTVSTESTYVTAKVIENLHSLIENNGGNFDLTDEELELAERLY